MVFNLNHNHRIRKSHPSSKERKLVHVIDVFICIIIRFIFLIQASFSIYFMVTFYDKSSYLVLSIFLIVILVDAIYVTLCRKGKEYTWYSISSICYTICIVVLIWNLVLTKFDKLNNECYDVDELRNNTKEKRTVEELKEYWLFCITRWAFPIKKKLRREALSNLLLSFITNGSDIVEFFGYIDEMDIGLSATLSISILIFFTLSAFQFSFTLSAKLEPSKKPDKTLILKIYDLVLGTEIWALTIVLLTQDLPFFIIRFLILIYYPDLQKNYTLYFFVAKSFILVIFELYYLVAIVTENKPETINQNDNINNNNSLNDLDDIQMTKF